MSGSTGIGETDGGASSSLRAALAAATDRLQAVLDDSEAMAESIVEEADARAKRILEEAEAESRRRVETADRDAHDFVVERLAASLELATEIFRRAEAVDRDTELLRSAASRLQATLASVEADRGARTQGVAPASEVPDQTAPTGSGASQLRAVQMAVGGLSDQEIERRLRQEFGNEDVGLALAVLRRLENRS